MQKQSKQWYAFRSWNSVVVVAWPLVTEIPLLSQREKIGKTAKSAIWIPLRRVTIRPATVATRGGDTAGSNARPSTVQPGSASCNALRHPQFSLNIVISCNALCRFFPPPLSSPRWTVFASYFYYSAEASYSAATLLHLCTADDEFCLAALSLAGDIRRLRITPRRTGGKSNRFSYPFNAFSQRWILLLVGWLGSRGGCGKFSVNFRNQLPMELALSFRRKVIISRRLRFKFFYLQPARRISFLLLVQLY